MLNKATNTFVGISILLLFLSVFTSASGLGASSTAAAIALLLHLSSETNRKAFKLPCSSYFLLGIAVIGLFSFIANYEEASKPTQMLSKLKYYLIAGLWVPVLKKFFILIPKKTKDVMIAFAFYALMATITIAGVYGFYTVPFGERSHGIIGIMRFSYSLALLSPIVWLYAVLPSRELSKIKFISRWGFIVLLVIILGCILTTQTRGGLIGFVLGGFVASFFTRRKLFSFSFLIFIILGIGIYITKDSQSLLSKSRYLQSFNSKSNLMRVSYYQSALYGILEKPFLGFGMQRFPSQITRIKNKHNLDFPKANAHSHNIILEIAAQVGLLGLLSFILWLIFWGKELIVRKQIAFFVCFVSVFLCVGQFEYIFFTNNMLLTFAIYHFSFLLPSKRIVNNEV